MRRFRDCRPTLRQKQSRGVSFNDTSAAEYGTASNGNIMTNAKVVRLCANINGESVPTTWPEDVHSSE
jgi:hypothetical protein